MDKSEKPGFKPGNNANPGGKPRGAITKKYQVKERLLKKFGVHPVDKLLHIANTLEMEGKCKEAAEIWTNLLKYFEPTKKPVEVAPEKSTPEDSLEAAEETFKLLQEMEQHGLKPTESSKGDGLENGPVDVSPKASTETDLPGHKEQ